MTDHHVHRFGCDLGGGHHQVAFVFAVLIIRHNHEFPGGNIREGFFDGVKRLGHVMRLESVGLDAGRKRGDASEPKLLFVI